MADIFISEKNNDPEATLYKIIKQLHEIKDTVFDMNNEESYFYEPVKMESQPFELPNFQAPIFKKQKNNKSEYFKYKKEESTTGFEIRPQKLSAYNKTSCENTESNSATKSH